MMDFCSAKTAACVLIVALVIEYTQTIPAGMDWSKATVCSDACLLLEQISSYIIDQSYLFAYATCDGALEPAAHRRSLTL
ncbi:MAG: hypothetical protein AAFV49_05735, partial [Pseudomonadota bacterium]